jgi:hypothetical protein
MEVSMTIQLPVGKTGQYGFTIVDDEDADISGGRTISKTNSGRGKDYCIIKYYKGKDARLHRLIAERMLGRSLTKYEVIDHRDGDPRNNQRSNLCVCTQRENNQNKHSHRNGRLVGASLEKKSGKWKAKIVIDNKDIHLGLFSTELEAHQAYQAAKASL